MTSIKLYELIDQDDPKCLYCNSECNVSSTQFNDAFKCNKCHEVLKIHYKININNSNPSKIYVYTLSCKDLLIYIYQNNKAFFIIGYINEIDLMNIPYFQIDFSDKEKLYRKLKTYIIFS